ncbi:cbl-associated protein isoform X4 [Leptinotarsa decemlineata]|uniref:cbl-associated protein isoform X4 n=1 Tax=Leptinotarsa decemlineata TaxID=7539 RepID=UPI003D309F57
MTTREVLLEGGAPWGFRMHGGADSGQQLRISRVNPGSKAAQRGIREGDLISSINGQNTKDLSNSDAHGLLRKSGDVLKLGLNEEASGSPKRRQYRTVHQETLQETVKRSSVTTYSVKKTVETVESQSEKNNENSLTNVEDNPRVNGTSKNFSQNNNNLVTKKSPLPSSSSNQSSPTLFKEGDFRYTSTDFAEASPRSSYTNCTLSPSSPSILSEDGTCDVTSDKETALENMSDTQTSSKSQRRRQRRKNRKTHDNNQNTQTFCDGKLVLEPCRILQEEYLVQSPAELVKKSTKAKPVKSRSLDDDDMVKIQEVSETSEVEDKEKDTQAIVSEASESEVEWEETMSLAATSTPLQGSMSTFTLPLEGYSTDQVTLISPEEEKSLRNFLESLNLVNGPEEAALQIYEKSTVESIKQRKAKKRAALEQYFTPLSQNSRFLDAISEEASDKDSDKEQPSLTRHLKQGTPELDVPPKVPSRTSRQRRQALPPKFSAPVEQAPAVLVDAKILENPSMSEGYCSTVRTEEASASTVEVVFLTSSGTNSPEEVESRSSDSYELEAGQDDKGESEVEAETTAEKYGNTVKSDHLNESCVLQEVSGCNETTQSTSSTQYSFTLKTDKVEENQTIMLLSQLTPPPTPENLSPKYKNILGSEAVEDSLQSDVHSCAVETQYTKFADTDLNTKPEDTILDQKIKLDPNVETSEVYTNVITPPPPSRSSSSSRSSSRESSLCTAKYNPSTSSIIEILSREEDDDSCTQPLTLRELCLKLLLTLPHGQEMLQELAEVSKQIDSFTRSLPSAFLPQIVPIAHFTSTTITDVNNSSYNLSVQKSHKRLPSEEERKQEQKESTEESTKTSVGVTFLSRGTIGGEKDKSDSLLGQDSLKDLSQVKEEQSKQQSSLSVETTKTADTGEREKIYIHEPTSRETVIPIQLEVERDIPIVIEKAISKSKEIVIPIQKDWLDLKSEEFSQSSTASAEDKMKQRQMTMKNDWFGLASGGDLLPQKGQEKGGEKIPDGSNKLLKLHEKYVNTKNSQEEVKQIEETSLSSPGCNRLLTIIKEEPSTTVEDSNYIYFVEKEPKAASTLPRETARLHAKDLSEWLNLARNKSMSESNLSAVPAIPENNLRSYFVMQSTPAAPRRRTSLPQVLYEKQLLYIQEKEREIQRQLEQLEEEKRLLNAEMEPLREFQAEDFYFSRKGDFAENRQRHSMPAIPTEIFRQQMYEEYMDKFAEREERKQHKVIKVTSSKDLNPVGEKAGAKEIVHPIQIEDEFMDKVKQKQKEGKLEKVKSLDRDGSVAFVEEGDPVLVIDGEKLKEAKALPKHLQEFVGDDGIWSPGQKFDPPQELHFQERESQKSGQDDSIPPVWAPKSASSSPTVERKEFKSVNFQSPVLGRKTRTKSENLGSEDPSSAPRWRTSDYGSDTGLTPSSSERRIPTSFSSPASGFTELSISPRLPKAQNPTITLLQKAREGQLPKGAHYIEQEQRQYRPKHDRPPIAGPGDILYQIKNEYTSESENENPRKMADLSPRKYEGIGPVSKDGMPLILRSEIKDQNQSKWYKRMYDTIHKQKPHSAQYPYTSGYLSEPEPGAYDSDFTDYKYQTLDRKRPQMQEKVPYVTSTMPRPSTQRSSSSDILRSSHDFYKNQPGRIENYTPGHSSISEKEAKEWWDEVMDIFDGWLDDNSALPSYEAMFATALSRSHLEQQKRMQPHPRSFINQALKESGYESDSTLVFRRKEKGDLQLSPKEQKEAYKVIQKGGDVPLKGLRKLAPERPKDPEPPIPPPKGHYARSLDPESPRKYVENEVTIHYKTPVRQEIKEFLSEDELAHRQAEAMKRIYEEERQRKHLQVSKSLQELRDMHSRRHTDNFIPSQKSPISLNRYDDFDDLAPSLKLLPKSPDPRLCARALYNFVGQTARELTFRKGDIIYIRRQIDKNWYEGELNAMVGLCPTNYVEIIPFEGSKPTPRKAHEGKARAKYNFVAQTHLELSLARGELVTITRKVDDNWFEGKIGGRKGIFPANYVEVLIDPQTPPAPSAKPVAAPAAHSLLLNGSSGGKESMGSHCYTPTLPNAQLTTSYHAKPVQVTSSQSYGSLSRKNLPMSQALHIETQSDPIPYRALYKYNPQNDDELELLEGDTVYVLEKCDDGWYVGSSNRTGAFGTFPGNYVEKI